MDVIYHYITLWGRAAFARRGLVNIVLLSNKRRLSTSVSEDRESEDGVM